tara:strand:- start:5509 stop:6036 length:528 start_codon:yes stop_codon:yes gene_type:complete
MSNKIDIELWSSAKYVSWPNSHGSPIVRVPTPSGQPESKSFARLDGETERDHFVRCIRYRDKRGVKIWGRKRWDEMCNVKHRSVAKHRTKPAGPITGVFHYVRPGGSHVWVATWYEKLKDESRRKRTKQYSYGKARSQFATSEQAEAAAIDKRLKEERRWYSTLGVGKRRKASHL